MEDETLIGNLLVLTGIFIILFGFLILIIGTAIGMRENSESRIRGGGVIMLGPIPIIFGSDGESAKTAIILAIILMVLSLLIFRGTIF